MSAIVTVVLKGTLGFLVKKGRQSAAERLKDGDVADQQLRSWIVDEIDNVNSKLDAIARTDLGASISFFKEGIVFLNKVMDSQPGTVATPVVAAMEDKKLEACQQVTEVTSAGLKALSLVASAFGRRGSVSGRFLPTLARKKPLVPRVSLTKELKKLDITNLDESCKEALIDAKKRFDGARWKATEAFNNEALSPSDRIFAMAVRLFATLLEKAENPASALAACRSGLEELHLIPFVRENFNVEITKGVKSKFKMDERRQIISSVCQINRIIYDVALMVGEQEGLFLWPCVEIGNERVDPLRDSRVVETLRELDMGDRSVAWSFGQEGEDEQQRLKKATSIATNTLGQFLVADSRDSCIKVFETSGKFLYSFGLPAKEKKSRNIVTGVVAVGTDSDDNIYVLANGYEQTTPTSHVYVFNKQAYFLHGFFVDYEFRVKTVTVKDDHLLVSGRFHPDSEASEQAKEAGDYVAVVRKSDGTCIGDFSEKTLTTIQDITATDDSSIMMLDDVSCVYVFSDITADDGDDDVDCDHRYRPSVARYLRKFPVVAVACAIAFHWPTRHVIIASKTPEGRSQVLLYSKEGKLERSIALGLDKTDKIMAASVTTDGRICITASDNNRRHPKSKVLVL